MSNQTQRQNELLRIINNKGMLSVKALASMLGVSEMTIRRDLSRLQEPTDDLRQTDDDEYNLISAAKKRNEQKERIGRFAASMIAPDDIVIIDTGSTTAKIPRHISDSIHLSVICYNGNLFFELRRKPNVNLFVCGGFYHENTEMLECPESIGFIETKRANKAFLSAAGVHQTLGITCENAYEVPTKNAALKSSSEKILLADSSKFGQVRASYVCPLTNFDAIVTDSNLSQEWQDFIAQQGIRLHLV